jgi:hypothetical protein
MLCFPTASAAACLLLFSRQVSPQYQGSVQLSASQLLQLLHYQQVLHSLLNWSSKVRQLHGGHCV